MLLLLDLAWDLWALAWECVLAVCGQLDDFGDLGGLGALQSRGNLA